MKKTLLSCVAIALSTGICVAQDAPALPDHLDFTLNGEKELAGVNVKQVIDESYRVINISGSCEAAQLTVTFDIPEGWDGMMIQDFFGYGIVSEVKTRAESDWLTLDQAKAQMFQNGNSITFDADGEANPCYVALVKDDLVYTKFFDLNIEVSQAGGSEDPGVEPGDEPVFPESLGVTIFNEEGLEFWQGVDEVLTLRLTGTTTENQVDIVLDVPEGWDGFLSYSYSDDITVGENVFNPRKTRAEEYEWYSVEECLELGYVKGNRFSIIPNGEEQDVAICLYKGDYAELANWISLEVNISKEEGSEEPVEPVFPESIDFTVSNSDVEVWQGPSYELPEGTLTPDEAEVAFMMYSESAIVLSCESSDQNIDIAFNLPEGWKGVLPVKINLAAMGGYKTRANATEWMMVDELKQQYSWMGLFDTSMPEGTEFSLPMNEKQIYICYLYADVEMFGETYTLADMANTFLLIVDNGEGGEVSVLPEFPSTFDVTLSAEGPAVNVEKKYFWEIEVDGTCATDEITVTVEVPEGWDGFISDYNVEVGDADVDYYNEEWQPVAEMLKVGYVKGNEFTFKADGEDNYVMMYLYKGDKFNTEMINLTVSVKGDVTGVASVESADAARYYDLQGNEIAKPASGIYVKVANGKASKVVVK